MKLIKSIIVTFFSIVMWNAAQGQNASVNGTVKDTDTKLALYKSAVELMRSNDSLVVKAVITNADGSFLIDQVKPGNYYLRVTFSGYRYVYSSSLQLQAGNTVSVHLEMQSQVKGLGEVVVKSRRPAISFQGDKMVVDPQQMAGASSSNALQLLKNMPGVSVENEQTISLNGQQDITVLIDDRKRTLTLEQAVRLLKTIPASNVKQVEISFVKSARHDASGSGGVINIVTKKPLGNGYNLQFTSQFTFDRYTSSLNNIYYNHRINKFTLFTSAGFERNYAYTDYTTRSAYQLGGGAKAGTNDIGTTKNISSTPYLEIGTDYAINRQHTIGVSASIYGGRTLGDNSLLSAIEQGNNKTYIDNKTIQRGRENLSSVDLLYTGKLDSLGSKLRVDIGYLSGFSAPRPWFLNVFKDETGVDFQPSAEVLANLPLKGYQYIWQADYDKVFNKKNSIQFGIKHTSGQISNNVRYDTIKGSTLVEDIKRTDNLKYQERITAAYLTYKHTLSKKFNFMLGLRYEHTYMKNISLTLDSTNLRTFNDFFPSASFSYNGKGLKSTLSFSRSISRPFYGYLNPYVTYQDEFNYQIGNSNLAPGYSYNINLNNSINNFLFISMGYSRSRDMVFLLKRQIPGTLLTEIKPENALNYSSAYLSLSSNFSLFKGAWEGQARVYGFAFKTDIKPQFFTSNLDTRTLGRYTAATSHTVRLVPNLFAEGGITYYSRNRTNQAELSQRWQADFGLRKKIKSDFLTVSAMATDIFNTMRQDRFRYYDGFESLNTVQFNTQRFRVALLVNLGKLDDDFSKTTSTSKESSRYKNN